MEIVVKTVSVHGHSGGHIQEREEVIAADLGTHVGGSGGDWG